MQRNIFWIIHIICYFFPHFERLFICSLFERAQQVQKCICARSHTHTNLYRETLTYVHTYIHTYTRKKTHAKHISTPKETKANRTTNTTTPCRSFQTTIKSQMPIQYKTQRESSKKTSSVCDCYCIQRTVTHTISRQRQNRQRAPNISIVSSSQKLLMK